MKEEEYVRQVRLYLDVEATQALFEAANKTEDVGVLKRLVQRAKILHSTYLADANFYLKTKVLPSQKLI